jgi:hypothetical protein
VKARPAFKLGEPAPDPVRLARSQRVLEALLSYFACGADSLRFFFPEPSLGRRLRVIQSEEKDGRMFQAGGAFAPFLLGVYECLLHLPQMVPVLSRDVNVFLLLPPRVSTAELFSWLVLVLAQ